MTAGVAELVETLKLDGEGERAGLDERLRQERERERERDRERQRERERETDRQTDRGRKHKKVDLLYRL